MTDISFPFDVGRISARPVGIGRPDRFLSAYVLPIRTNVTQFTARICLQCLPRGEQAAAPEIAMHFVFEVHVHPGYTAEQYAEAWVRASRIIQQAPGAKGTRLHRKLGDPTKLLAIATWESKSARDAMEANPSERVREIIAEQARYVDVRVIGEFDDADWVVLPGD